MAPVTVYSTRFCGYCVVAKNLLKRREIPFEEIDVSRDHEKRQWLKEVTGRRTVPQIFIGEKSIGGCEDLYDLDESGELQKLLASEAKPLRAV